MIYDNNFNKQSLGSPPFLSNPKSKSQGGSDSQASKEDSLDYNEIIYLREAAGKKLKAQLPETSSKAFLELTLCSPDMNSNFLKVIKVQRVGKNVNGDDYVQFFFNNEENLLYEPNIFLIPVIPFVIRLELTILNGTTV